MPDENRIRYDRRLYDAWIAMLLETGRFQKTDKSSLINLSNNSQSQLEKITKKQVSEEIPFWSRDRFEEIDIDNIMQLSLPQGANAYWMTYGRKNIGMRTLSHILNIRFYNLSD